MLLTYSIKLPMHSIILLTYSIILLMCIQIGSLLSCGVQQVGALVWSSCPVRDVQDQAILTLKAMGAAGLLELSREVNIHWNAPCECAVFLNTLGMSIYTGMPRPV